MWSQTSHLQLQQPKLPCGWLSSWQLSPSISRSWDAHGGIMAITEEWTKNANTVLHLLKQFTKNGDDNVTILKLLEPEQIVPSLEIIQHQQFDIILLHPLNCQQLKINPLLPESPPRRPRNYFPCQARIWAANGTVKTSQVTVPQSKKQNQIMTQLNWIKIKDTTLVLETQ